MLFIYLLALIAASNLSLAKPRYGARGPSPRVVKHGMFPGSVTKDSSAHRRRAPLARRQTASPSSCGSGTQLTTKAPKSNIFAGLTDDEAAGAISFLHTQQSLNLTAAATATR